MQLYTAGHPVHSGHALGPASSPGTHVTGTSTVDRATYVHLTREERARKAGKTVQSPETLAAKLVRNLPTLSAPSTSTCCAPCCARSRGGEHERGSHPEGRRPRRAARLSPGTGRR
jgi:hypothetical protein